MDETGIVRRVYARQMLALANAQGDRRLEDAFAAVRREDFVGTEPWLILPPESRYVRLDENDPLLIYQDVLVALAPERCINTGSPALHAKLMHAMAPPAGATVFHLGIGGGYYTAILAELVGATGKVIAIEFDERLAKDAARNLADYANVQVVNADGAERPDVTGGEAADCIYVNFAVARPAAAWIDGLRPGGRLVFPLGVPSTYAYADGGRHAVGGVAMKITRVGDAYAAAALAKVSFVFADGRLGGDDASLRALSGALGDGQADKVRSLAWRKSVTNAWYDGGDWALSFDEVGAKA